MCTSLLTVKITWTSKTIVINGNNEICDVGKIIDKLNMKVDMENTQV